jgi:hypothetical protein
MRGEWYAIIALGLLSLGFFLAVCLMVRRARRSEQNGNPPRPRLLEAGGVLVMAFVGLVLVSWIMGSGRFWVLEAPMRLVVGWVQYLDRAGRDVEPDATHVASAVVCLVATAVVAHLFLRSLAASVACAWTAKRTFQVLLLVVLMFASGLAVTGLVQQTGWLIRTPEPLLKDNRSVS